MVKYQKTYYFINDNDTINKFHVICNPMRSTDSKSQLSSTTAPREQEMRKKITRQREQPVIEVMKPVPLHAWYAVPQENSKTGATKIFEQRQQCLKKFWVGQEVHPGFSIRCCGKTQTNFSANPILNLSRRTDSFTHVNDSIISHFV